MNALGQSRMLDEVVEVLRQRYGDKWAANEDANLRFSVDAEFLLRGVSGVHLVGEPEIENDRLSLTVWVDFPLRDLMAADLLAYEIFGRLSEDLFYSERHFEASTIRYTFVTGSTAHGHIGTLILAGPHAAEFAGRHHKRSASGRRYHA